MSTHDFKLPGHLDNQWWFVNAFAEGSQISTLVPTARLLDELIQLLWGTPENINAEEMQRHLAYLSDPDNWSMADGVCADIVLEVGEESIGIIRLADRAMVARLDALEASLADPRYLPKTLDAALTAVIAAGYRDDELLVRLKAARDSARK